MKTFRAQAVVAWEFELEDSSAARQHASEQIQKMLPEPFKLVRLSNVDGKRRYHNRMTLGEFAIEDVLPYVTQTETKRVYVAGKQQYLVRMNSHRYFVFKANLKCVVCGLLGVKMLLEKHPKDKSPHFNLYGEEDGQLVLMTKDHIHPVAGGGKNELSNYQTMCTICNNLKANGFFKLDDILQLRMLHNANKHLQNKSGRAQLSKLMQEKRNQLARSEPVATPVHKGVALRCDVHVIESAGVLQGISAYTCNSLPVIACIKRGTRIEPIEIRDDKVVIPFDDRLMEIHQGLIMTVGSES